MSHGFAATHYVTPSGAGGHDGTTVGNAWSQAEFEALTGTGYAGDTFYFSESSPFGSDIDVGILGTSGNQVVLDGYEAGSCDPWNDSCANGADVLNFNLGPNDYITIQDFDINYGDYGITMTDNLINTGLIIRHNHFYSQSGASIQCQYCVDPIIWDNYIQQTGTNYEHCIDLRPIRGGKIIHNKIRGDSSNTATGIWFATAYSWAGNDGIISDNIVAGNDVGGIWQEAISFDNFSSGAATNSLEYDTISSTGANTVTLSDAGWSAAGNDLYNNAYMFFLTGDLKGNAYQITDQALGVFTFSETVSSAGNGDIIVIGVPFLNNYVGYNTVSDYGWNYASVLLYGVTYGTLIEGHTDESANTSAAITIHHDSGGYEHTGSITGVCAYFPAFNNLAYNNTINNIDSIYFFIPGQCGSSDPYYAYYNTIVDNTLGIDVKLGYEYSYVYGSTIGVDSSNYTNNSTWKYKNPYIIGTPYISLAGSVYIDWSETVDFTGYTNGDLYLTTAADIETTIALNSSSGSGAAWVFTPASTPVQGETYKLWFNGTADSIVNAADNDMIVVGYKPISNYYEDPITDPPSTHRVLVIGN